MPHMPRRLVRSLLLSGGSVLAGRPQIELAPVGELVLSRIVPAAAPGIDGIAGDAA